MILMSDKKTLDLRAMPVQKPAIQTSAHVLSLSNKDANINEESVAMLSSTPEATLNMPDIPIAETEKETKETHITQTNTYISPSSFHPEPILWQGYLHGHSPSLPRVSIFIILMLLGSAWSFFYLDNIISAFLFISIIIALVAHVLRDKEFGDFRVDELGVSIHGTTYKYKDMESFWIDYHPQLDIKELSIHLKSTLHPYLKVPIYDINPVQLRHLMLHYLSEVEHRPSLADALTRHLKI